MNNGFMCVMTILGFFWIVFGCFIWIDSYINTGKGRDFLGAAVMLALVFTYLGIWMEIYT